MKKPRHNLPRINPLAFATLVTSPEFGKWAFGRGPRPELHSVEILKRLLQFYIDQLNAAVAGLEQGKAVVEARQWGEAARLIRNSFAAFTPCASGLDDMLQIVKQASRSKK
jgi:hypothetical protein